jgi:hypothetical protein
MKISSIARSVRNIKKSNIKNPPNLYRPLNYKVINNANWEEMIFLFFWKRKYFYGGIVVDAA